MVVVMGRDLVGRGERWYPRIVGGVVGIACAPIDQDITRVSCGTVVLRTGCSGVAVGVALAAAAVVVDCAGSVHCFDSGVLNIDESTCAGSAHSSPFESLNIDESTCAGSAHSSPFESLNIDESTCTGSAHRSPFESLSIGESAGAGSAHSSSSESGVVIFVGGIAGGVASAAVS